MGVLIMFTRHNTATTETATRDYTVSFETNIMGVNYWLKTQFNALLQTTYKLALMLFMATFLIGCATFDKTIESVRTNDNEWTADLEYRVRGYASGFSVAIYRTSSGPLRAGEGSKEPFKTHIRASEPYSYKQPPISIKWINDRSLHIHHNTRMSIEDSSLKLKITKADSKYQEITISYDPKPVIWE